jgi:hypothetical protein
MTPKHSEAVGYVRSMHSDPAWLERADAEVRACGAQLGYDVTRVFRDDASDDELAHVAGFMSLLDGLRDQGGGVVLVSSPAHLSFLPDVRRWMARMIVHVGARVVVVQTADGAVVRAGEAAS